MLAAQYFTAVAGMAAMRHCLTDPSMVRARLDDVRAVVDRLDEFPNNLVVPLVEYEVSGGYDAWAPRYDEPNPAVDADESEVHRLLAGVKGGVALDAACGTGRHSAHLSERGFAVIGVDANRSMLALAESKVPAGDFRLGDLAALPVDDAAVDVVVCSLALTHVERLEPVIAEFARVTRPGGLVVLSDIHPTAATFGGAAVFPTDSARFELHFVRDLVHPVSDYVRAIVAAGLVVRGCREPVVPESVITANPAYTVVPEAVRQAFEDLPFLLVWSLEKPTAVIRPIDMPDDPPTGAADRSATAGERGAYRSRGFVDYGRVAARYQQGRSLAADVLDRWGDAVGPYLPRGPIRVADVGAGTGIFAAAWPRWTNAAVVAIEPSAAMTGAGSVDDPDVSFVLGTAEALPLVDGCAEVVWVSTALHHFADVHLAVGEFGRVLGRGGRVLVRTYAPGRTEISWLDALPGRAKWEARCHTEQQLTGLFSPQGFDLIAAREVLEGTESYAKSAEWVERMRDADSLLTALSDEEIAEGVSNLRSTPNKIGRLELTLFVFQLH